MKQNNNLLSSSDVPCFFRNIATEVCLLFVVVLIELNDSRTQITISIFDLKAFSIQSAVELAM